MANTKHAVVRTDNLGGTKNGEQLASVIFYSSDAPAAIDNGNIVVLGEKLGREAYKATAPAAGAVAEDLYVIAEEELFYDQSVAHYLTEWVNEAGKTIRAYSLDSKGGFSVTAELLTVLPRLVRLLALLLVLPRLRSRTLRVMLLLELSWRRRLLVLVKVSTPTSTLA